MRMTTRHDSVLPREDEIMDTVESSFHDVAVADAEDTVMRATFTSRPLPSDESKEPMKSRLPPRTRGRNNRKPLLSDPVSLRKRTDALLSDDDDSHRHQDPKADKKTFHRLIDAWARCSRHDSADMALRLLRRMEYLHNQQSNNDDNQLIVAPTVKTYNKVLRAVSYSQHPDAGRIASDLLNEMKQQSHQRNLTPNTMTYTHVIDAISRSTNPEAPHTAQRLVQEMTHPTARVWNSVIQAWSTQSQPEKASQCLDIMEKIAESTNNEEVRPNEYNINTVISAYAKSGRDDGADKAIRILQKMERLHNNGSKNNNNDNNVRFVPRVETYNAIIDAYAKSGQLSAPHNANLLLQYMTELYVTKQNIHAKPNVRSYNSVMNAWAKSKDMYAPEQAMELLNQMEEENDLRITPDTTSYATAINAYARSLNYDKAEMAYGLYQRMERMYKFTGNMALQPNTIVCNSVLNACAFTVGDVKEQCRAIDIAKNVFTRMINESALSSIKPDEVTYGTYLKVICNQMPEGGQKNEIVKVIFRKAAKDGLVGKLVFRQVKEAIDMDGRVYDMCFGDNYEKEGRPRRPSFDSLDDLPISWTMNVRRKEQRLNNAEHARSIGVPKDSDEILL